MAAPVFKTGVTRLRQVWWVRFPHSPASALIGLAVICGLMASPRSAGAQVPDTTRPPAVTAPADTTTGPFTTRGTPPISSRRAFVRSLFIPGYGQMSLERTTSAGLYALVEVIAVGMLHKSALDLREARRAPSDSTVLSYERDPATGQLLLDPETGLPIPASYTISDLNGRVRARKTHMEDWIAVLIFNHLFSAADAFVAAHLWDFPARVGATVTPSREARVSASFAW